MTHRRLSTMPTMGLRAAAVATVAVGALLALPAAATAADVEEGEAYVPEFVGDRDDDVVTVAEGDSLAAIAVEVGLDEQTGWVALFDANDEIDDPDLIHPGQELEVPEEDEELERRPVPSAASAQPAEDGGADDGATADDGGEAPNGGGDDGGQAAEPSGSVSQSVWDQLAQCESGGDWSINTGNGFYGGLQFHPDTWAAYGGHEFAPNAHLASRDQEIVIAERVLAGQGWGAWPSCSSQLGLR